MGFAVFVDDGAGGAFTEVNQHNDPAVRNNPGLHTLEITSTFSDPASIGLEFRIKVNSYNVEGDTDSDTASIILADTAEAPTNPVKKIQSLSSTTSLAVEFDELAPE